jgi:hypothetical protein
VIHSEYLDLAVGMAVVFFLCSLVVSGLNEGINWMTRVRAKFLWAYLYDLFGSDKKLPRGYLGIAHLWRKKNDPRPAAGGGDTQEPSLDVGQSRPATSWLDGLARSLNPIDAPELQSPVEKSRTTIKSVPSNSLAQAMLEVFADVGRQSLEAAITTILDEGSSVDECHRAIERIANWIGGDSQALVAATLQNFRDALIASDRAATDAEKSAARKGAAASITAALKTAQGGSVPPGFDAALTDAAMAWPAAPTAEVVRAVADAISHAFPANFARQRIEIALSQLDKHSPLYPTLRRLWEGANRDVEKFRAGIETYLDAEMKRLSGYYRRSIRTVVLSLGLIVTVVGGIDTVAVAQNLWRNPDGRAELVREADQLAAGPGTPTNSQPTSAGLQAIQAACESAHPADDATISTPDEAAAAYAKVRNCVTASLDSLTGLGVIDHAVWTDWRGWKHDWTRWYHSIGLLVTALALLLGAPFWFDAIKRVSGIRKGLVGDT